MSNSCASHSDNDSSESDMNAGCGIVSILGTKTGTYSGSTCNGHSTVPNPWANGGTLSLSIGSQSDKGDTNGALTNCPPSQAAVNAGLITCTDTGSTGSSSYSWNFTEDQFLYTGQNLPQQPTAALSVRETRNVLQSIGRARDHGLGVLYIDHNMNHVLPVADRIVLLELGRVVRVIDRGEIGVEELQDLIAARTLRAEG